MRKRSTRQRIAMSMALLTGGVVLIVTLILNIFVFYTGYRGELRALQRPTPRGVFGQRFERNIVVDENGKQELERGTVWKNISFVGDDWFVVDTINGQTVVREITALVERQEMLLFGSMIIIFIASSVAYLIAHALTQRLLKNIESLTEFVETRTVESLQETIVFPQLPDNDSLARLAHSITETNHTLAEKIHAIQEFALYAAHELKSPLMSMQGSLDLALKTTNYHKYYSRLLGTVENMQQMIQSLLVTVDAQRGFEKPQLIVLRHLLEELCSAMNEQYGNRKYRIIGDVGIHTKKPLGALTTVVRNLLSNAWKYHQSDRPIQIEYTSSSLSITNVTPGVDESLLPSFWIPFWQFDTTNTTSGHGLGLGVVQSVCTVYDREVSLTLGEDDTIITTVQFV